MLNQLMEWTDDIPPSWRYIYTNCPVRVVGMFYHQGGGFCNIKPGFIYTVEYENDSKYYDPDVRFPGDNTKANMMVHEMWLKPIWTNTKNS